MKCYDEGTLLAYLDGEVAAVEAGEIKRHLVGCDQCRQSLADLEKDRAFVNDRLALYARAVAQRRSALRENEKGVLNMLGKYRYWAGAAVAAGLAVSLSFGPVRAVAQEFLTIFRVEKVETVAIDPQKLEQVQRVFWEKNGKPLHINIENFGTVSNNGKGTQKNIGLAEAEKTADFDFKVPGWLPFQPDKSPEVNVDGAQELYFKLKVKNVNNLLEGLGSQTLLPESLDGKTFTWVKPDIYSFSYHQAGATQKEWKNLHILQSRSPELKVPADVNVIQLRQAILNLPAIPEEIRKQLASIEDWENTLVIPDTGGLTRKLTVNGAEGVFVSRKNVWYNTLIWQKDGVITILDGNLTQEQLLRVAESMR